MDFVVFSMRENAEKAIDGFDGFFPQSQCFFEYQFFEALLIKSPMQGFCRFLYPSLKRGIVGRNPMKNPEKRGEHMQQESIKIKKD